MQKTRKKGRSSTTGRLDIYILIYKIVVSSFSIYLATAVHMILPPKEVVSI